MKLVEVVILVGSQCLSPIQSGDGVTEVSKVPCAVLIRQDPATNDIDIIPQSAATDPNVIAMLVKPRRPDAPDDVTGSLTAPRPVPQTNVTEVRVTPAADDEVEEVVQPKPKPGAAPPRKKAAAAVRRTDNCGSYRAVWYTNKSGHRKYRCVKAG